MKGKLFDLLGLKEFFMENVVLETIASYEAKAGEYILNTDQLSYFPDLPAMLEKFISILPGKRILDVAFGSGRDTRFFLDQGLDVQGVELAQIFIDILRKKVDIPLYKMDMRQMDFPDNSFDGIWCCSAFVHLPRADALPTLKEFHRVLRPGGILYVDLKEGEGEKWVVSPDGHVTDIPRFFTYYFLEDICHLLTRANFTVEYTRKQPHPKYAHKNAWLNVLARKTLCISSV
jgi:ubiquinone/menaquinone biosynthesis C-methylase UbiE